jgi:hypothetical protein
MAFSWSAFLVAALSISFYAPQQAIAAGSLPCDFSELPSQLGAVVEPAFQCQTASGYSFVQPPSLPTAAQLKTICGKCSALLRAIDKAKTTLPTCALSLDSGNSVTIDKLLNGVVLECARAAADADGDGSRSRSSDGSSGNVEPPTVVVPTIAPTEVPSKAPATPKPKKTTVKPTTTSSASSDSTEEEETTISPQSSPVIDEGLTPAPQITPATPRPIAKKTQVPVVTSAAPRRGLSSTSIMAVATCILIFGPTLLQQPL